jgi:hypothetical protein
MKQNPILLNTVTQTDGNTDISLRVAVEHPATAIIDGSIVTAEVVRIRTEVMRRPGELHLHAEALMKGYGWIDANRCYPSREALLAAL